MEDIIMTKGMLRLLQLNSGTFPAGAFTQSWGLETYVAEGLISSGGEFAEFLKAYVMNTIGKCEGPLIIAAFNAAENEEEIRRVEELSVASKVTKESRENALKMGKALIRVMRRILEDREEIAMLDRLTDSLGDTVSYAVAYGVCCRIFEADIAEAVESYVFNSANSLVQCAVKLIPLGNSEGQRILFDASDVIAEATAKAMETEPEDITNFNPGIDIAGIKHESLKVRLYMS